jgi:hypothetical protein
MSLLTLLPGGIALLFFGYYIYRSMKMGGALKMGHPTLIALSFVAFSLDLIAVCHMDKINEHTVYPEMYTVTVLAAILYFALFAFNIFLSSPPRKKP